MLMALAIPALMMFGTWNITGCDSGSDGDGDADSDSDGDGDCTSDPDDGDDAVFVVSALEIGSADVGFNLDGVDTPAGCDTHFCSTGPDDGASGVDNRLGPILESIGSFAPDFDANTSIEDALLQGSLLILFRMRDVDDWTNDGCTRVNAYMGFDPSAEPAIEAGRSYQVDSRSLTNPSDIDASLIAFNNGSINRGTYTGGPSAFSLNIPISDVGDLEIQITDTMLRWDASATQAADGLIGGFVSVHNMLDALRQIEQASDYMSMVPAVMEAQADIDNIPEGTEIPGTRCTEDNAGSYDADGNGCGSSLYTCSASGRCVEPEDHFDGISLALTFTAISAEIDGIHTAD